MEMRRLIGEEFSITPIGLKKRLPEPARSFLPALAGWQPGSHAGGPANMAVRPEVILPEFSLMPSAAGVSSQQFCCRLTGYLAQVPVVSHEFKG
jgi:hypothetical protein